MPCVVVYACMRRYQQRPKEGVIRCPVWVLSSTLPTIKPFLQPFKDFFMIILLFAFELECDKVVSVFITLFDAFLFFRPQELDFKYVMKVSSLKESLPEAAFGRQNYLEQKGLSKCNSTLHILGLLQSLSTVIQTFTYTSKFHLKCFIKWFFEKVIGFYVLHSLEASQKLTDSSKMTKTFIFNTECSEN